jgi:glycosyltransferase involved in cell wall biosynthesis
VELRIAGEGQERPHLLALTDSLRLQDRVHLCGHVKDVPSFLRETDIFALSSDTEEHPNALNEAMASGLACVSTDAGCAREQLEDGACGKVVSTGDQDGMVAALEDLICSVPLRHQLGDAARQRACAVYSREEMLSAYEDLYRGLSRNEDRRA